MESTTGHRESIMAWKPLYLDLHKKSLRGWSSFKYKNVYFLRLKKFTLKEPKRDRIKEKKGEEIMYSNKKKNLINWNTHSCSQFFLVQYNFRYKN